MRIRWTPIKRLRALEGALGSRISLADLLGIKYHMITLWHLKKEIPKLYHKKLASISNNVFKESDFK